MKNRSSLIVLSGFSGTGKTTLSRHLVSHVSGILLSVDEIERILRNNSGQNAEKIKYPVTLSIADRFLKNNKTVILDGNFKSSRTRQELVNYYNNYRLNYFLIHCDCPEHEAERRIRKRHQLHPGHYKKTASYSYSKKLFDPIIEHPHLKLNTNKPIENCVQEILQYIHN